MKQLICNQNSRVSGQLDAKIDFQAVQAGANEAWFNQAIKHIKSQEYEATINAAGRLQAPNRQQNLRIHFQMTAYRLPSMIKQSVLLQNSLPLAASLIFSKPEPLRTCSGFAVG